MAVQLSEFVPRPIWPLLAEPQHFTDPVTISAQECWVPVATWVTSVKVTDPGLTTSPGTGLFAFEPLPRRPNEPLPQHRTRPPTVTAQLWKNPVATWVASSDQTAGPVKAPVVVEKVTPGGSAPVTWNVGDPASPEMTGATVWETCPVVNTDDG